MGTISFSLCIVAWLYGDYVRIHLHALVLALCSEIGVVRKVGDWVRLGTIILYFLPNYICQVLG